MILTFMYYIFFASAVFFYGVGLNDVTIVCDSIREMLFTLIKMVLSIIATTLLCFLFENKLLIPLGLIEFIPLVALLVYFIVSILFESLFRISAKKNTAEFNISYLVILLALYESSNIIDAAVISCSSFISFAIILPVLYAIKKRIDIVGNIELHGNKRSLVLVSLAILAAVLAVFNVSWLTPGVLP